MFTPVPKKNKKSDNANYMYVVRCAIWCFLYNLKNVKNAHGEVQNITYHDIHKIDAITSCLNTLIIYFPHVNEDFEKVLDHSKLKEAMDRGNEFGLLLTDLSKAFECIDHKLLIAKFYYYGNSPESMNIILY